MLVELSHMWTRLNNEDPSVSSTTSASSPVTYHVILWVLLSLAINSMAQPASKICGVPSRSRIYLASSPIICLADALSVVIRLVTLLLNLPFNTGLRRCLQLVVYSRQDVWTGSEDEKKPPEAQTWPRWLFFIIGTLPATIKVSSFAGTPWTKTWGLMFATSFAVVELLKPPTPSPGEEDPTTTESILGFSPIEWEEPQNNSLRSKLLTVNACLDAIETLLFVFAIMAHAFLLIKSIESLKSHLGYFLTGDDVHGKFLYALFHLGVEFVRAIISISFIISSLVWLIVCWCVRRLDSSSLLSRVWVWSIKLCVLTFFLPQFPRTKTNVETGEKITIPRSGWLERSSDECMFWIYLYAFGWACHWGLSRVCRRWPGVVRALLIDQRLVVVSGEGEVSAVDESGAMVDEVAKRDYIDENAWLTLCFFVLNLTTCVLWYAFDYDSTATVNPAWTDVFG